MNGGSQVLDFGQRFARKLRLCVEFKSKTGPNPDLFNGQLVLLFNERNGPKRFLLNRLAMLATLSRAAVHRMQSELFDESFSVNSNVTHKTAVFQGRNALHASIAVSA